MKFKIPFLTLAFYILFLVQPVEEPVEDSTVEAGELSDSVAEIEDLPTLEEIYLEGGYMGVSQALQEAEDYFKKKIALPTRLPEVAFTHHFAIFSTLGTPELAITYLNENSGSTHYKINVSLLIPNQKFSTKGQTLSLNDGSKAVYRISENFDAMFFEKDGFEYIFMVDKIHPGLMTKEVLVDIANSIK